MANERTTGLFVRWNPTAVGDADQQRLRQNLTQITDAAEFGPLPGSYTSFQWNVELPAAGWPQQVRLGSFALPQGQEGLVEPPFQQPTTTWSMWPMFVGYWVDAGEAKVMLEGTAGPGVGLGSGLPEQRYLHAWDDTINLGGGPGPGTDPFRVRTVTTVDALYGGILTLDSGFDFLDHDINAPTNDADDLRPIRGQLVMQVSVYDIISGEGGLPTRLTCNLICKYLQKVDPATG